MAALCPEKDLGFDLVGHFVRGIGAYHRSIIAVEQGSWSEKAFNCCGAAGISHLAGRFNDDKQVQSFLAFFIRHFSLNVAYYYIITDPYLHKGDVRHIVGLLDSLGAEVIDKRPNRVHGPSIMHMMVWEPSRHLDFLDKHVKRYPADKSIGYACPEWEADPLWFFEEKKEEKAAPVTKISNPNMPAFPVGEPLTVKINPRPETAKALMAQVYQQEYLLDKRPDLGIANKSGLMDQWLINEGAQQNVPDKW